MSLTPKQRARVRAAVERAIARLQRRLKADHRRRLDSVTVTGKRPTPVVTLRWPDLGMHSGAHRRRVAEVVVIRGAQGTGKTTVARALALAATSRGETAVVFEGDHDLRGLASVAKHVDLVVICHLYEATLPKLPRGLRPAFVLTCKAGA